MPGRHGCGQAVGVRPPPIPTPAVLPSFPLDDRTEAVLPRKV
jgi:hypothetical protein